MKRAGYQTVYLWTCPECGSLWHLRHRPRAGVTLACAPSGVQRRPDHVEQPAAPCGALSESTGKREGLAPNL